MFFKKNIKNLSKKVIQIINMSKNQKIGINMKVELNLPYKILLKTLLEYLLYFEFNDSQKKSGIKILKISVKK